MNLNGTIIKGKIEYLIEEDIKTMENLPEYNKKNLVDMADIKHYFVITQSKLFERLLDLINLYISKNEYEESKEEEYNIIDDFIKYTNLVIKKNKETISRLFKGREVSSSPITKLYDKNILLNLIEYAKDRNRVDLQSFLISTPKYSDFYGTRLENEYNKFNSNFLASVMTFAEATEKWELGESTLRSMVKSNRLEEGKDYRKSGKVWLIRKDSMQRIYGEPKQK